MRKFEGPRKWQGGVMDPRLSAVMLLFCLGEGEVDLMEGWVEDSAWEFLQEAVEGMGVEQFEDGSG